MTFDILVEETLARKVTVEAESPADAIKKVDQMYQDGKIYLGLEDWDGDVEISEVEQ